MPKPSYKVESDAEAAFEFLNGFFLVGRTDDQKGIVLRKDDEVIAAVLYVQYSGPNVFMHVAGKPGRKWVTRDLLFWTFHYPFTQMGVSRVSGWVEADNKEAIRFNEHLGFTKEATLVGAGRGGVDVYIYKMLKENCRYG